MLSKNSVNYWLFYFHKFFCADVSKPGDARAPLKSPGVEGAAKKEKPAAKVNLTTCPIVPGQDTTIEIVKVSFL